MNKVMLWFLGCVAIPFAIYGLWVGLEMLFYGEIQTRIVDDFIGIILFISLMSNYTHYLDKRYK